MSRRTALWKKRFGDPGTSTRSGRPVGRSGNGGSIEGLLPDRVVRGKFGNVVTEPMGLEKRERITAVLTAKRPRR